MGGPVYTLDTNIASCVIKGNRPSVDRMLGGIGPEQVRISVIVEVLPWDSTAAKQYAALARSRVPTGGRSQRRRLVRTS